MLKIQRRAFFLREEIVVRAKCLGRDTHRVEWWVLGRWEDWATFRRVSRLICLRSVLERIWALEQSFTANDVCTTNLVNGILAEDTCSYSEFFFRLSSDFFVNFDLLIRCLRSIKLLIFTCSLLVLLLSFLLRLLLLRLNFRFFLLLRLLLRWNNFSWFLILLHRISRHNSWWGFHRCFLYHNWLFLFANLFFLGSWFRWRYCQYFGLIVFIEPKNTLLNIIWVFVLVWIKERST